MTLKELKKHVGKYRVIGWVDPQSALRTTLDAVKKKRLAPISCVGKILHVDSGLVIIETEHCGDDEGDYTSLHPALITSLAKPK